LKTIKYDDVYYLQPDKNPVELKQAQSKASGGARPTGRAGQWMGCP